MTQAKQSSQQSNLFTELSEGQDEIGRQILNQAGGDRQNRFKKDSEYLYPTSLNPKTI